MNVTVQVTGAPEDVAAFLREIGGKADYLAQQALQDIPEELKYPDTREVEPIVTEEKVVESLAEENDSFKEVPDPGQEAMDVVPSESEPQNKPSVTYAQLKHAMKGYALRYQQRHSDIGVDSMKEILLTICEKIGGAGEGEGSKGIKESNYDAVYQFFIEDREI